MTALSGEKAPDSFHRKPDPARVLTHPAWWLALAVLIINDGWLKGAAAGLGVPAWLPGKLSDFAGMIVAPLLLAALLRANSRRARGLCFAVVGGLFAASKLSASVAAALVWLASLAGQPWRIVVDPTDLLALSMLPLAWWLASHQPAPRRPRPVLRAVAALVAVVACLGSARPPVYWNTDAFVVNTTESTIDVRVSFYEGTLDCEHLGDHAANAFDRKAFSEGISFALESEEVLPLRRLALLQAAGLIEQFQPWEQPTDDSSVAQLSCDAVLLQGENMPNIIAWWGAPEVTTINVPTTTDEDEFDDNEETYDRRRVDITGSPTELQVHSRGKVHLLRPKAEADDSSCDSQPGAIQWSVLTLPGNGYYPITAIDTLLDGCLDIELETAAQTPQTDAEVEHLLFCLPAGHFPFEVGDEVRVQLPTETSMEITASGSSVKLVAHRARQQIDQEEQSALSERGCGGSRLSCGAFVLPAKLKLGLAGKAQTITPGEAVDVTLSGTKVRLVLGRAERVVAAPKTCPEGRNQAGPNMDYLLIYGI